MPTQHRAHSRLGQVQIGRYLPYLDVSSKRQACRCMQGSSSSATLSPDPTQLSHTLYQGISISQTASLTGKGLDPSTTVSRVSLQASWKPLKLSPRRIGIAVMPRHQGLENRTAVAGNAAKSKSAPSLASNAQTPRRAKQPTVATPFTPEGYPALTYDVSTPTPKGKKRKADGEAAASVEKRQRRYRPQPPQSFHDVYGRALSQR